MTLLPNKGGNRRGDLCRPACSLSLLLACTPVSAAAQEVALLRLSQPAYATEAIRAGDPDKLPAPHSDVGAMFMDAIRARISGRPSESIEKAEACYARTRDNQQTLVGIGEACKELAMGAHFLEGDLVAWANAALELEGSLQRAFASETGGRPVRLQNFNNIDFAAISRSGLPAASKLDPNAGSVVIPRFLPPADPRLPSAQPFLIEIEVNGSVVVARVDTGASISALSPEAVRLLNVSEITSRYLPASNPRSPVSVATSLVKVDDLVLGGIHLEDVAFASGEGLPNIVGLDLLRRLSPLLFTDESLTINEHTFSCAVTELKYRSNWTSDFSVLARLKIDGATTWINVDTGDNVSLAEVPDSERVAGAEVKERVALDMGGLHTIKYVPKTFRVGGVNVSGELRPDYLQGDRFRLGSGILKSHDFWMDAVNMKACLVEKKATR